VSQIAPIITTVTQSYNMHIQGTVGCDVVYVLEERSVSILWAQDSFAMNIVAVHSSNRHILKDRHLHSRHRSLEKMKPNNGTTRRHTRRKPQPCLGVFRVLQNNKPHSMNTHTWRYSATLSGQSALDGDEYHVMSEMPNEERCDKNWHGCEITAEWDRRDDEWKVLLWFWEDN